MLLLGKRGAWHSETSLRTSTVMISTITRSVRKERKVSSAVYRHAEGRTSRGENAGCLRCDAPQHILCDPDRLTCCRPVHTMWSCRSCLWNSESLKSRLYLHRHRSKWRLVPSFAKRHNNATGTRFSPASRESLLNLALSPFYPTSSALQLSTPISSPLHIPLDLYISTTSISPP